MSYLEAFWFGLIQGFTEFLPISSSAHLILLPQFLGIEDPGLAFSVLLHLGTMLSTLVFFRQDWIRLFKQLPRLTRPPKNELPLIFLICSTIPALIVGALFHDQVEHVLRGNHVIIFTLAMGGALMAWVDWKLPIKRNLKQFTLRDALYFGVAQCLALLPGVSRSGATITGGRLLGFNRSDAAKYSFLMATPVIAAAVVYELRNWSQLFGGPVGTGPLIVAFLSSFLFGILAIGALLRIFQRFGFGVFALYRIGLAIVIWKVFGI